jgi:hypothetical protein
LKRLVRTDGVVNVAPFVEPLLLVGSIEGGTVLEFPFYIAMHALVRAVHERTGRKDSPRSNPEADPPCGEAGQPLHGEHRGERSSIVGKDLIRQPILLEKTFKSLSRAFVAGSLERDDPKNAP